jgi:uncharacterized protein
MSWNVAVIGSGIAGLTAAFNLSVRHRVTLFEAAPRIGGHTHTHRVWLDGKVWHVDSGFIVFNDWTYPRFNALMRGLGVASQESEMSFSVRCEATDLEYNGASLNALFAQRINLLRPPFLAMVRDILRFNREAPRLLETPGEPSLADYVRAQGYSRAFVDLYLVPMAAAIWSADPRTVLDGPARFFVGFFRNHGMLSVNHRPTWRTLRGGSSAYLAPLTRPFASRIRTGTPARAIRRRPGSVLVNGERFDAVVLACHSDEALRALADPSAAEREVLGAIRYQENEAVLHTDTRLLPRRRLAWAAWNYHIPRAPQDRVALTYNMNILQRLAAPETLCVTLNHSEHIDPARVISRMTYHHPVMDSAAVRAQARHAQISADRTYFCGAYWGNGFHEDGVVSAETAVAQLERDYEREYAELPLLRAG